VIVGVPTSFVVSTLADVGRFFGVALQTVKQWRTETDPMPGRPGAFDLSEIARWRIARAERGGGPKEGTTKSRLEETNLALEVQRRKVQLDRLQETLVDRAAVELFCSTCLTHLGDWCDQLPQLVAAELPKSHRAKIANRIRRELDQRREQLSSDLRQLPRGSA